VAIDGERTGPVSAFWERRVLRGKDSPYQKKYLSKTLMRPILRIRLTVEILEAGSPSTPYSRIYQLSDMNTNHYRGETITC